MRPWLWVWLAACAPMDGSVVPTSAQAPPGVGGLTLSGPVDVVEGVQYTWSVTSTDLLVGDRVDMGWGALNRAGRCPYRQLVGGALCMEIDNPTRSASYWDSAIAVDDPANPGSAIALFTLTAPATRLETVYLQVLRVDGPARSATSNVLAVNVTEPLPEETFVAPGCDPFTVPAGVTELNVRAWGGGGGGGLTAFAYGGGGAYVEATLPVTPGELLNVCSAEGGTIENANRSGTGGGASILYRGSTPLVVAGGGGGGGADGSSGRLAEGASGGAGGAAQGEPGEAVTNAPMYACLSASGGTGGTQSAGGIGGTATTDPGNSACDGLDGGYLAAGAGHASGSGCQFVHGAAAVGWESGPGVHNGVGGGGGSGYYGGGAGGGVYTLCGGGGGGGSSYVDPSASSVVMLGGSGRTPGDAQAGLGGDYLEWISYAVGIDLVDTEGGDGLIEITW